MNTLLGDAALRARMARAARERVEQQFSWTSIARQTLDFYQELIDTHDSQREHGP